MADLVRLPGSERQAVPGAQVLGDVPEEDTVEATVVLNGPSGSVAEESAIDIVRSWAEQAGLQVTSVDPPARSLTVSGDARTVQAAFGTRLALASVGGRRFRQRTGRIGLPSPVAKVVSAVLGLDDRPQVRPHIRTWQLTQTGDTPLTPAAVADAYGFPPRPSAHRVAILEFGGGYSESDTTRTFQLLTRPAPTVNVISVGQAPTTSGQDLDSDTEVMLDIGCVAGVAELQDVDVIFAPPTTQGYYQALARALHGSVAYSALLITWGNSESAWPAQAMSSLDALLADAQLKGVLVCVSCGDAGSANGVADGKPHVDFPASSPHVLAVGGTHLTLGSPGPSSEVVWNDSRGATGGGISTVFARPDWQPGDVPLADGFAGRGVPDVAAPASPGYTVVVHGMKGSFGGTSAAAPVLLSLVLTAADDGQPLEGFPGRLYAAGATALHEIIDGSNDVSGLGVYAAGPGWNACCGLGRPDGDAFARLLRQVSAPQHTELS